MYYCTANTPYRHRALQLRPWGATTGLRCLTMERTVSSGRNAHSTRCPQHRLVLCGVARSAYSAHRRAEDGAVQGSDWLGALFAVCAQRDNGEAEGPLVRRFVCSGRQRLQRLALARLSHTCLLELCCARGVFFAPWHHWPVRWGGGCETACGRTVRTVQSNTHHTYNANKTHMRSSTLDICLVPVFVDIRVYLHPTTIRTHVPTCVRICVDMARLGLPTPQSAEPPRPYLGLLLYCTGVMYCTVC